MLFGLVLMMATDLHGNMWVEKINVNLLLEFYFCSPNPSRVSPCLSRVQKEKDGNSKKHKNIAQVFQGSATLKNILKNLKEKEDGNEEPRNDDANSNLCSWEVFFWLFYGCCGLWLSYLHWNLVISGLCKMNSSFYKLTLTLLACMTVCAWRGWLVEGKWGLKLKSKGWAFLYTWLSMVNVSQSIFGYSSLW